ncbi:MAG TPA: hypothetical protein VNQ76_22605, partial [Planctomicrobium sp.]|nr:hypothetical protein [Planctomicrobium sp.]
MRTLRLIACLLIGNTSLFAAGFEQFLAESGVAPITVEPLFTLQNDVESFAIAPPPEPSLDVPAGPPVLGESELPPAPRSDRPAVSTVETPSPAIVDLRPPEFSLDVPWLQVEPSWLDEVIDDHVLIWQSVTDSVTTVPRAGTDFGITTIGFKVDLTGD